MVRRDFCKDLSELLKQKNGALRFLVVVKMEDYTRDVTRIKLSDGAKLDMHVKDAISRSH